MEITVYSTKVGTTKKLNVTGTTYGQVRRELINAGLLGSDMSVVLKENKMTLQNEDIVMPTSCYTLLIVPTKTKSGSCGEIPFTKEEVEDLWESLDTIFEYVINHVNDEEQKQAKKLKEEAQAFLKGYIG